VTSPLLRDKNIIDVVKFKWVWIGISLLLIVPGIIAMIYSTVVYPTHSPLKLGMDFTGGSLLQYGFSRQLNTSDITTVRNDLAKIGIENSVIQIENADAFLKKQVNEAVNKQVNKSQPETVNIKSVISIRTRFLSNSKTNNEINKVNAVLKSSFGSFVPLQVSQIGPTLGTELFKNSIFAMMLAFAAIVAYLAFRFQLDYGVFALIALFHDALFICGVFAILGLLFGTEIDSMFITAILTVIGFSVHDTIVVFDRIRENSRFLAKKMSFNDVVNASVNQTLARSINTSLTVFITLLALFFLGGVTTRDFVLAMILGILIGTYSSIFNAGTLLAMWRSRGTKPAPKAA